MMKGSALLLSYIVALAILQNGVVNSFVLPSPNLQQQRHSLSVSHKFDTKLFSDMKYESSKGRRVPGGRASSSSGRGGGGRGAGRGGGGGRGAPKQDYRNKNSVGTTSRTRKSNDDSDSTWMPISTKWRLFNIDVLLENDPGKDVYTVHDGLINSIHKSLGVLIDTKVINCYYYISEPLSLKEVQLQQGS